MSNTRRLVYLSLGLGVVWFVLIEIIMINHQEPIWGLFFLICIAAIAGIAAIHFIKRPKIILLMLPLHLVFLIIILFGNIDVLYLPIVSLLTFYISQYLILVRIHTCLVLLVFVLAAYISSFLVLPKYLIEKQTIEVKNREKISFNYTSNMDNRLSVPGKKLIILEFWNSRCSNCFKKMKLFTELQNEIGDKCDILCVYADYEKGVIENFPKYQNSLLRLENNYPLSFAYDSLYYHYDKDVGLPQTLIVSPEGKVLYSDAGYIEGNKNAIKKKYKEIVKEYILTK
jgi:thiol-disulfide isomerase/thioredoxin